MTEQSKSEDPTLRVIASEFAIAEGARKYREEQIDAAPFTSYTEADVMEALDEALLEVERTPETSVWASFWDRLTFGDWIPKRPEHKETRS